MKKISHFEIHTGENILNLSVSYKILSACYDDRAGKIYVFVMESIPAVEYIQVPVFVFSEGENIDNKTHARLGEYIGSLAIPGVIIAHVFEGYGV